MPQVPAKLIVSQIEIDFGPLPVEEGEFVIIDGRVKAASRIIGVVSLDAPTGKDADEIPMDLLDLAFAAGNGQFVISAVGRLGYVADKFKINYSVG